MIADIEVARAKVGTGMGVFARRSFEEVTLEYRVNALDGDTRPCRCGTPVCTGTVEGSFFAMTPQRQALLLPHAPAFIQREHRRRGARL